MSKGIIDNKQTGLVGTIQKKILKKEVRFPLQQLTLLYMPLMS